MNKQRLCFILLAVFSISFMLLGLSYSKESGTLEEVSYNDEVNDKYRIIYSNGKYLDSHSYKTQFNIVNLTDKEVTYSIRLKETQNKSYSKVYYKWDYKEEKELTDGSVLTITLKPYGTSGDLDTHELTMKIPSKDWRFKIVVEEAKKDVYFKDKLKSNSSVYKDKDGDYRFYGSKVNNYIKYNGELCQIIGVVGGKIKVITASKGLGKYDTSTNDYATLKDYLYSFNNSKVNESNVLKYKSWMTGENGYWLKDSTKDGKAYYASKMNGIGTDKKSYAYYRRYVYYINGNAILVKGNGTSSKPYEVTYESK